MQFYKFNDLGRLELTRKGIGMGSIPKEEGLIASRILKQNIGDMFEMRVKDFLDEQRCNESLIPERKPSQEGKIVAYKILPIDVKIGMSVDCCVYDPDSFYWNSEWEELLNDFLISLPLEWEGKQFLEVSSRFKMHIDETLIEENKIGLFSQCIIRVYEEAKS